jgi:hypothetical protein
MHNRKVFVFQDLNYGSSKTSTTANTALTPADLASGAVGVYGIHEAGATNLNKLVLITDGGSESAGKVPAASFVGREVIVAMGTVSGHQLSNPIQYKMGNITQVGLREAKAGVYAAPVRGVVRIGYNPATLSGSLNLPATISRGDNFQVSIFNRNYFVSGGQEPGQKVLLSGGSPYVLANDTPYTILKKWIANVNLIAIRPSSDILIDTTKIKIVSNAATGANFSNTATAAVTNGSTAVTTSAAHGITAGQYIAFGSTTSGALSDLYIATAVPTTTTITLDRPYQGVTNAALGNTATWNTGSTTAPTLLGLELTDAKDFYALQYSVQDIAKDATVTVITGATFGSGSQAEVLALEKEALPKKGTEDLITSYIPKDVTRANGTYDLYFLTVDNSRFPDGDQGAVFQVLNYLTLAFVSGVADTAGKNQGDFENVMTTLFTTFPQIS